MVESDRQALQEGDVILGPLLFVGVALALDGFLDEGLAKDEVDPDLVLQVDEEQRVGLDRDETALLEQLRQYADAVVFTEEAASGREYSNKF